MTAPARRPWYRKKRWIAALAVWLLIAYPVSEGPVRYAEYRGWNPDMAVYRPLDAAERWVPGLWTFRWQWKGYWVTLADNQNRRRFDDMPKP